MNGHPLFFPVSRAYASSCHGYRVHSGGNHPVHVSVSLAMTTSGKRWQKAVKTGVDAGYEKTRIDYCPISNERVKLLYCH